MLPGWKLIILIIWDQSPSRFSKLFWVILVAMWTRDEDTSFSLWGYKGFKEKLATEIMTKWPNFKGNNSINCGAISNYLNSYLTLIKLLKKQRRDLRRNLEQTWPQNEMCWCNNTDVLHTGRFASVLLLVNVTINYEYEQFPSFEMWWKGRLGPLQLQTSCLHFELRWHVFW